MNNIGRDAERGCTPQESEERQAEYARLRADADEVIYGNREGAAPTELYEITYNH